MKFKKSIALFFILLILSIPFAIAEESDEKTFIFPRFPEQPDHSIIRKAEDACPPLCPVGYTDEGVSCDGSDCTRKCSIMVCSDSGSVVLDDYSNDNPEWRSDYYDNEDDGKDYTPSANKCYQLEFTGSQDTDSEDSECYDLYTDDNYDSGDYDEDCEGNDIDAYAGIGFVGKGSSSTWLRTLPGSPTNIGYGYIGNVQNSNWEYRYISEYGRDPIPDESGRDAGNWDAFSNEICDEAGTYTIYCAPSYEACNLWGKSKCGYGCAGETTRSFVVMGVYADEDNNLGDALDDRWECGDIEENDYYAYRNHFKVTEYSTEKQYSNTQASCCMPHDSYSCYNNDVYWYDSCSVIEEKKEECYKSCSGWGSNYCKDGDVYHSRTCYNTGCSGNSCYSNSYTSESKVADCSQGCSGGSCLSCTSQDHYSCYDNDVYWYDSCGNRENRKQDCGPDSCNSWGPNYCKDGDVYHSRTCSNRGCSGNSCYSNSFNDEEKQEDCPSECSEGACLECTSGICCATNSKVFKSSSYKCRYYEERVGCYDDNDDVYHRYVDQYCSGSSSSCNGRVVAASDWYIYEKCDRDEYCDNGDCVENCDEDCKSWQEKKDNWKYKKCDNFDDDCDLDDVKIVKYYPNGFSSGRKDACSTDSDCCEGSGECMEYHDSGYNVCVFDNDFDNYWQCITPPDESNPECSVPDGSSEYCDCDSDFDCPYSHPYCEDSYGPPVSDGYDACLSGVPVDYCGDRDCSYEEDIYNCPEDCETGTGTISITVTQDGTPIEEAIVEVDDKYKGRTDSYGKIELKADYGTYVIKACCPDGNSCSKITKVIDNTKEYAVFRKLVCQSAPTKDSDGDGMWDEEEELFGTDPDDANDNFDTLLAENEVAKGCFDLKPIFNGILKEYEKDKLIQQLELYSVQEIKSLADYDQQKIESLLASAGINTSEIEYNGTGLASAVADSAEIDFVQNGVSGVFIITDQYGITSLFPLLASCSGNVIGLLYGAGMGVKDDATFVYSLIKGLWHYATHIKEIANIWGDVVSFIKSVTWDAIESMFREVSLNIFKRGRDVLDYFGIKPTKSEYVSYQIGFYQGYVLGYIGEQVAFLKGVGEAFKSLKVGAKLEHVTSRAAEILARITHKFGGHVADSLRSLRIWQKAVKWGDDVVDGMAHWVKKGGADDISKFSDDIVKKTSKQLNDFDISKNGADFGKWSSRQATRVADKLNEIDNLAPDEFVDVYVLKKKSRGKDILAEGFDYSEWRKEAPDEWGRFEKQLYGSFDLESAKDSIVATRGLIDEDFVIFKGKFRPSGKLDETYKIVPTSTNDYGINLVDMSWKNVDPGKADLQLVKEFGDNLDAYPTFNPWRDIK